MNSPHDIATTMMTAEEARKRVTQINSMVNNIRALVLDFHDREGWKALGYENWAECVQKEFSIGQSHVYRLFEAAKIEARINENSPIGENEPAIPESHLRPLTAVPEVDQPIVYKLAKETAPEGKLTAKHVERTVREVTGQGTDPAGPKASSSKSELAKVRPVVQSGSGNNMGNADHVAPTCGCYRGGGGAAFTV